MTRIHWLEQTLADVPEDGRWLSAGEQLRAEAMRFPKRRTEWLLGRWTGKCAIACCLGTGRSPQSLAAIQLVPGSDGAPVVLVHDRPASLAVSISHRGGAAVCAVAPGGTALGCDLEQIEPHSEAFVSDYFTSEEQWLVRQSAAQDHRLPSLLWSAKESVLKLLHTGLRLDTRTVSVRLPDSLPCRTENNPDDWHAFSALFVSGAMFRGWWQINGSFVKTLVSFPPAMPPIRTRPATADIRCYNLLNNQVMIQGQQ
jgi:4'-phosphopantetheinyl transferase